MESYFSIKLSEQKTFKYKLNYSSGLGRGRGKGDQFHLKSLAINILSGN